MSIQVPTIGNVLQERLALLYDTDDMSYSKLAPPREGVVVRRARASNSRNSMANRDTIFVADWAPEAVLSALLSVFSVVHVFEPSVNSTAEVLQMLFSLQCFCVP